MPSRYQNTPLIPYSALAGNKVFPIQRSVKYPEIPDR